MKLHGYVSEGIVLARRNYGEADRILVIYSKDHGKTSLIAKGIRKPKSKKRGHVEVFNLVRYQISGGRNLGLMIEAEVIDDFKEVRESLRKISLAYYFVEVIGRITHEGEKNKELFDFILDYLTKLKSANKLKELRVDFVSKLLVLMGYWPANKYLTNPDIKLEEVIERQISSARVGKRMLS